MFLLHSAQFYRPSSYQANLANIILKDINNIGFCASLRKVRILDNIAVFDMESLHKSKDFLNTIQKWRSSQGEMEHDIGLNLHWQYQDDQYVASDLTAINDSPLLVDFACLGLFIPWVSLHYRNDSGLLIPYIKNSVKTCLKKAENIKYLGLDIQTLEECKEIIAEKRFKLKGLEIYMGEASGCDSAENVRRFKFQLGLTLESLKISGQVKPDFLVHLLQTKFSMQSLKDLTLDLGAFAYKQSAQNLAELLVENAPNIQRLDISWKDSPDSTQGVTNQDIQDSLSPLFNIPSLQIIVVNGRVIKDVQVTS